MSVLLFRLIGPMQSWGIQSRFSIRDTGREPTKSGVIGILCAALGRGRSESLADLCALRLGVRIDHEGRLAKDYHTAQNVYKSGGGIKDTELSTRYYLSDAVFLVGLEGDRAFLESLDRALRAPVWQLSLGRKSFLPSEPIPFPNGEQAIFDSSLEEKLQNAPLLVNPKKRGFENSDGCYRVVIETPNGQRSPDAQPVFDQPISFADRTFAIRYVRHSFITLQPPIPQMEPENVS